MKHIMLSLTVSALAVFALGCSSFNGKSSEETIATPKLTQEVVEEVVYAASTNPVSLFYSEYYEAVEYMQQLFESRLENESAKYAADSLLHLAAHDAALSEGRSTFGLLLSTDAENTYSSSLMGIFDGTGTITPVSGENFYIPTITTETEDVEEEADDVPSEDTPPSPTPVPTPSPTPTPSPEADAEQDEAAGQNYSLYFAYSNSRVLYGSLTPTKLAFATLGENGGAEIHKEGECWYSYTSNGSTDCMLSFDGTVLTFQVKENYRLIYSWECSAEGIILHDIQDAPTIE